MTTLTEDLLALAALEAKIEMVEAHIAREEAAESA